MDFPPKMNPMLGDRTPEFMAWLYKKDPKEFLNRYWKQAWEKSLLVKQYEEELEEMRDTLISMRSEVQEAKSEVRKANSEEDRILRSFELLMIESKSKEKHWNSATKFHLEQIQNKRRYIKGLQTQIKNLKKKTKS